MPFPATGRPFEPVDKLGDSSRDTVIKRDYELLRADLAALLPDRSIPLILIQHRLVDFKAQAEALQPCRERPAQVMQPPTGNTGGGVER
jgi:hypothetical protein